MPLKRICLYCRAQDAIFLAILRHFDRTDFLFLWYDQFGFEFCNTQWEGVVKGKLPLKDDTARVLEYVRLYINERNGVAPSMREIANGCFISVSQVATHLEILEAYGVIRRTPGRARAIWLLNTEQTQE